MAPPSRRLLWLAAPIVALLCLVIACSGDDDASAPTATTGASAASPTTAAPTAAAPTTAASVLAGVSDEPVAFETEDGVVIRGHLYTRPGPTRTAVIFAHMYPADQTAWQPTAQALTDAGLATLTFDFRGYGESAGDKDIANIDRDLRSALYFLEARDYTQIYLVGASMGGTAALKVAATEEVAGVMTVSAPEEFRGLSAKAEVAEITAPKLFVASRGDGAAADSLAYFMDAAPEPKQSQLFDGDAHGTDLLTSDHGVELTQLIRNFVRAD